MSYLPCIEIEPKLPATAAVIWLHGLGANGHDFETIVPALQLPDKLAARFVLPNAPSIPVTINGGMVMPAWYDVLEMSIDRKVDGEGIQTSAQAITALIEREVDRGIDSRRIVVAGFSQGGAIAYEVALRYPKPLAGLMALSSYFATRKTVVPNVANSAIPIYVNHGTADPLVPEFLGQQAVAQLKEMGYHPEYKTYPMEHAVCPQQIGDISGWLQKILLR